jgi:neutral/alkaline ceramidase-like enzyme
MLHVGLGRADITPPVGTELAGFGPYLERKSERVLHPLWARACVFRLGRTKLALVQLDLVGVIAPIAAAIRRRVRETTGIPGKNVMICCSHTHSGPSTSSSIAWGEPNPTYIKALPKKVARAVKAANTSLRPAELFYAEGRIEKVAVNRVGRAGKLDSRLVVLRIEAGGEVIGFISHCSVHPVVLGERNRVISGDFVSLATELVAAGHPGSTGLFLQGACGDINATETCVRPPESLKAVQCHGEWLAASIRKTLAKARPLAVDRLEAVLRPVTLPQVPTELSECLMMYNEAARLVDRDDVPDRLRRQARFIRDGYLAVFEKVKRGDKPGRKTEIQAFAIGEMLLLAEPGELFHSVYKEIRRTLGRCKLILAGYSNDAVGYIPEPRDFKIDKLPLPGYQYYAPYYVPIIKGEYRFRPDVGQYLKAQLIDLATEMRR